MAEEVNAEVTKEEEEPEFCPLRPQWAAAMLSLIGPVGKLKKYRKCKNVQERLEELKEAYE